MGTMSVRLRLRTRHAETGCAAIRPARRVDTSDGTELACFEFVGDVIYSMGMSLDGYVEDRDGSFAFSAPDDEMHRLANAQARDAAAFLFGRRLYEVMEG